MKKSLMSAVVSLCFCVISFAQWQQVNSGLTGGNVLALHSSQTKIFAGTNGAGVFTYSEVTGWANASQGLPRQPTITAIESIDNTIFAGLYFGGVYKSSDNGSTWSYSTSGSGPQQVTALMAVDKSILAGSVNGLFMSTDLGVTWVPKNSGLPENCFVNAIISTPSELILAASYKGLYRSTDKGNSWQSVNNTLPTNANVGAIVSANGILYAGLTNAGIYTSTDGGISWTSLGSLTSQTIYSLAKIDNALYAGTFGSGLFKSSDNGATWTQVNLGRISSVSAIRQINNGIWLGTSSGIYKSADGINWTENNTNLNALVINSLDASGTKLIAGADFNNGIYFSDNTGQTWSSVFQLTSSTNTGQTAVVIKNDTLIASHGILTKLSTNGGATWSNYAQEAWSLLIHKEDVYRGTGSGLFVNRKNGIGWTSLSNGINANQWVTSLAAVGNSIFAGTIVGQGVLRSDDKGVTWTEVNNGFNTTNGLSIIALFASSNKLFAVTNESKIYVSSNLGNTWALLSQNITGAIHDMAFKGNIGYMATSTGVYISLNNGSLWTESTKAFPTYLSPRSIALNSNTLFMGTSGGVYSIPLSTYHPEIVEFSPASGDAGTLVTIKGNNFTSADFTVVKFNGTTAEITLATANTIIAKVPAGATTGKITVEIAGEVGTSLTDFCVIPPKPVITADLSDTANPKLVSSSAQGNQWYLNEVLLVNETAQILSNPASGSYSVKVTTNGCSSPSSNVYCYKIAKPSITSDLSDISKPLLTSNSNTGNQWFVDGVEISGATQKTLVAEKSGTYTLRTTLFGCQSPLSDPVALIVTGIENRDALNLSVYPSPTSQYLWLTFDETIPLKEFEVIDVLGKRLKNFKVNESPHVEDLSDLKTGIYFIRYNTNNINIIRFIKK